MKHGATTIGHSRLRSDRSGFSLIEIAIALIILGLIMTPILESYNQRAIDDKILGTGSNLSVISVAIQDYYARYNSLPCPADPALAQGNANYGVGDCTATLVANAALRAGAVPFVDLHIPAATAIDAWQTKIGYTMVFADKTAPLQSNNNIIKVETFTKDGVRDTSPDGDKKVHYVLVSYGPDALAGYSPAGKLKGNCPAYGSAEHLNCSNGGIFMDSRYISSMTQGSTYLDDLIAYNENLSPGIWTYIPPNTSGNAAPYYSIWTQDYVGIGTPDPTTFLDVAGNIRLETDSTTTSSQATSNLICNASGQNCFPATVIAGNGMGDGPSQPTTSGCVLTNGASSVPTAMTAVRNADAICAGGTGIVAHCASCASGTTCPAGKFLSGIDASGSMTCVTP